MAIIAGVTVEWTLSPRLVIIPTSETEVTVEDLQDTLLDLEWQPDGMAFEHLRNFAGGEDLGGGTSVGFTMELQNAKLGWASFISSLETGTVTTPDTNGITLIDSAATFIANGVEAGDSVANSTDGSRASVLEVVSEMELRTDGLVGGADNQFDSADAYEVFDWQLRNISGGNVVAVDGVGAPIDPVFPTFGNYVVRTSSSSATLQEQGDIQHASFGGAVNVDVTSATSGTVFPAGNVENPVNNWPDAVAINAVRKFDKYSVLKSTTLDNAQDFTDAAFVGKSIIDTVLAVPSGTSLDKAEFFNVSLEGTLGETTIMQDCFLGETNTLNDVQGVIEDCSIGPAKLTLGGTSSDIVRFVDCRGAGSGTSPPTINCNGDGPEIDIQGYIGQLNIENKTGEANLEISINGKLTLDATCTNGIVIVNGNGTLIDNSGPNCTVIDNMVHGDKLTEVHIHRGLDAANAMTFSPTQDTSADGSIVVAKNRFHSHMNYGDAITETKTRQVEAAITFKLPLTANLNDTVGSMTPTFTRANPTSTYLDDATGLITAAGTDVARFEIGGLLIEEQRENLVLQSEDLATTWSKDSAATISTNVAVAPDGASTADRIEAATTSLGNRRVWQTTSRTASADGTCSAFFKKEDLDFCFIEFRDKAGGVKKTWFNVNLGTIGINQNDIATIRAYPNGWYRCSVTNNALTGGSSELSLFGVTSADGVTNYNGTAGEGNLVWGCQTEDNAVFATSYIPTTTLTVTRSADFLSYDDDTVLLDAAGSLYAEITPLFKADQANDALIVNIADQQIGPMYITDDTTQKLALGDGTTVANYDPTFVRGTVVKVATRWSASANEMQAIASGNSGTAVAYDAAFTRAAGTLYIGSDSTGNHFNGNIRSVIGYNTDRGEDQLKVDTG